MVGREETGGKEIANVFTVLFFYVFFFKIQVPGTVHTYKYIYIIYIRECIKV